MVVKDQSPEVFHGVWQWMLCNDESGRLHIALKKAEQIIMIENNQEMKYILQQNVTNQDIVRINKTPKAPLDFPLFSCM